MKEGNYGSFHVVGVGPGDPELITMKGVKVIESADVIVAPSGRAGGASTALEIVAGAVSLDGKEVLSMHFPMVRIDLDGDNTAASAAWKKVAEVIANRMRQGRRVVFPTLGDPAFYSTAFYVISALSALDDPPGRVRVVPGVSAMGACAATAGMPTVLAGEMLAVVPALFSDDRLEETLAAFDSIVLMKVNRSMERIIAILERMSLVEYAVLVERTTMADERIWQDIRTAPREGLHYFSTVIVRKRGMEMRPAAFS